MSTRRPGTSTRLTFLDRVIPSIFRIVHYSSTIYLTIASRRRTGALMLLFVGLPMAAATQGTPRETAGDGFETSFDAAPQIANASHALVPLSRVTRRLAVTIVQPGAWTLQDALDAASAGDELVLADGYYYTTSGDNVVYIDKSITIRAQNQRGAILSGSNTRRVVAITSGTVILEGLDITGGKAESTLGSASVGGGGIYIVGGAVTINNCTIHSNTAPYANGFGMQRGAGIRISGGTAVTFNNCDIHSNTVSGYLFDPGSGGGVFSEGCYDVAFNGCCIHGNSAYYGAGAYVYNGAVSFTNCQIYDNDARSDSHGPNMYVEGGSACTFGMTLTLATGTISTCPAPPSPSPSTCPAAPSPGDGDGGDFPVGIVAGVCGGIAFLLLVLICYCRCLGCKKSQTMTARSAIKQNAVAVHAPKEQTQAEAIPSAPSYDTEAHYVRNPPPSYDEAVHDVRDTSGGKAPFGKAEKMQAGAMAYQELPCHPQSASQLGATVVTAVPAVAVQPAVQMPGEPNKIKALKGLKELLDAGALTQEEFEIEKKKILEGPNGVWNA